MLAGVCQAHGGRIAATDLKDLLVPRYMPAEDWSSWWGRARTAAKRSDRLSLEGRHPIEVVYHPGGRSLEDELAADAEAATMPLEKLEVLRRYVRDQQALAQSKGPEQRQQQPGPLLKMTLGVVPEPVVSQLMEPLGQDVHQEAAEELDAGQPARFPCTSLPLLVPGGHMGVVRSGHHSRRPPVLR